MLLLIMLSTMFAFQHAAGQTDRIDLQQIQLYQLDGYDRLLITCNGEVVWTSRFDESENRLSVYLKNTRIALQKKDFLFRNSAVLSVHAQVWHDVASVVKLDILLAREAMHKIRQPMPGALLVELIPKLTGVQSSSQKMGDSEFDELPEPEVQSVGKFESPKTRRSVSETPGSTSGSRAAAIPPSLLSEERIALDVKEADVSNVLRLLSRQSNLNIVASNDVKGKVTLTLTGVTIKEALDMVVRANGLDYTVHDDIVLVKPREKFHARELETRVYRLKYLDANNVRAVAAQILSPDARVQVFYPSFKQVDLGEGEDKKIDYSLRSSTLIVTDSPENIRQLNTMVAALDIPTPQIMIEAKLIEVAPENQNQLGINWDKMISGQIFREIILPSGEPVEYAFDTSLEGGGLNYGTLSINRYQAVLDFLSKKTDSKLVSNPRILAMDNQEAVISVGTTFPIPQINRGVGGQGDQVTFEYRDINVALRVTPHLAEDETITLYVNPDVEEVIGQVFAGENSAPITSKRAVQTVVNLKDNETVVIGGLIRENLEDTIEKVWLLGDIPLVGNLFRNREFKKKQTDLLIFITPRIVNR